MGQSIVLIAIGVSIILGMLYTMVRLAKSLGAEDQRLKNAEADADLVKRQTIALTRERSVDDVADDADRGEF